MLSGSLSPETFPWSQVAVHVKSGRNRNSVTCNLCHSKVYLKCNYPNYLESQHVNYSKKEW